MASDQECSLDTQAFRHIREQFLSEGDNVAAKTPADRDDFGIDVEEDDVDTIAVVEPAPRASGAVVVPPPPLAQSRLSMQGVESTVNHQPHRATVVEEGNRIEKNHGISNSPSKRTTKQRIIGGSSFRAKFEDVLESHTTSLPEQRHHSPRLFRSVENNIAASYDALKRHRRQMEDVAGSIEPSDTQYLPSQVLADYLNGRTTFHNASRPSGLFDGTGDASESGPKTYVTGDTGHIDLALDLESKGEQDHGRHSGNSEDGGSEDELGRSQSQDEYDTVTSPAPLSPITPALAGQKRDREGNAVSQSTPLAADNLAALFKAPAMKGAIGLSQVFRQTQAPTSPIPDGPRSDPIFERPSPEFRALYNWTSPSSSSPMFKRNPEAQRVATGPKDMYVSMKDSQEVRNRQKNQGLLAKLGSSSDASGDEDELGEDSEERRAERKRRKADIEADARRDFAQLAASSAPNQLDRTAKTAAGLRTAETPNTRTQHGTIFISDDTPQVHAQDEDEFEVSEVESRDEYDELGQTVISSSYKHSNRMEQDDTARPTSSPLPSNHDRDVTNARLTPRFHSSLRDESNQDSVFIIENRPSSLHLRGSQSIKVADSQPDRTHAQSNAQTPHSTRRVPASSVNSKKFVPQSQELSSSTNLPDDLLPQSEILESSSIPRAPQIPPNLIANQSNALASDSPLSSPPPVQPSSSAFLTVANDTLNESAGETSKAFENIQNERDRMGESQGDSHHQNKPQNELTFLDKRHEMEAPATRKPIRTIIDTSPPSTTNVHSSPPHVDARTAEMGSEASSRIRERGGIGSLATSRSTALFDTAQTHQSRSPELEALPHEPSHGSPKLAHLRKFRSIDPNSAKLHQSSPVEANFDVLNEDDHDYQAAMSPASQRKKLSEQAERKKSHAKRKALEEPAPEANVMPPREIAAAPSPQSRSRQPNLNPINEEGTMMPSQRPVNGKLKKPTKSVRRKTRGLGNQDTFQVPETLTQSASEPQSQKDYTRNALEEHMSDRGEDQDLQIDSPPFTMRPPTPHEQHGDEAPTAATPQPLNEAAEANSGPILRPLFPNRVVARFKDTKNNYYPATCLDRRETNGSFVIRYDDGNVDEDLSSSFVASLELRPGDIVKIDRNSLRTKDFIIHELRNIVRTPVTSTDNSPATDIFGHQTAIVRPKQRESIPGDGQTSEAECLEVQISEIYLTSRLWPSFANRIYEHDQPLDPSERLHTPADLLSRPGTPSSRNRRHTLAASKKPGPQELVYPVEPKSGLFSNMVFAISYNAKMHQEKDSVSKMITENGGRLLADSFVELFDRSSWLPNNGHDVSLTLSLASINLGFAALITDNYSRRPKFIQALALNIPCLSGRWIVDSVAKRTVLPWIHYLLPAGESVLLAGSIRSRTFSEENRPAAQAPLATLKTMITYRPSLLQDKNVIMVMEKRGRGQAEAKVRRELHVFLSCALGATKVSRVKDIAAVTKLLELEDGIWDLVNVEDDDLEDARAAILGENSETTTKSRKARKTANDAVQTVPKGDTHRIEVIGEEFVVQSLIVGALVEHLE